MAKTPGVYERIVFEGAYYWQGNLRRRRPKTPFSGLFADWDAPLRRHMIFSVANELFDFMCWYYFFENVPASMSSSWDFGSIDKQGWWVEPDYLGTTAEPTFNTKLPAVPLDFIRAPSTGWPHPGPVDANIGIARRRLRDFLVRLIVPNAVTSMISVRLR